MESRMTTSWHVYKYLNQPTAQLIEFDDEIATEYPLTFRIDGEEFATMVCSPEHLQELAIGFLASEGVIRSFADIQQLHIDTDRGYIDIELRTKQSTSKDLYSKRFIGSCCGKSRQFYFHNDMFTAKTSTTRVTVSVEQCVNLMEQLQNHSSDFQLTGGVHNASLCTPEKMIVVRSDIGRHNALDKLFGYCLQHKIQTRDKIITFSGRMSSEVVLKAAKIGVGFLLSKSAPTDLALKLADDLGITCVGFIRSGRMNGYTHTERITGLA